MTAKSHAVRVTWRDAASSGMGWAPVREYTQGTGLMEIETLGYLIKKSRREVQVAQSRDDQGKVTGVLAIPRAWVKSIKRVR